MKYVLSHAGYRLGNEQRTVSCRTCTPWVLKCTMLSTSSISSLTTARSRAANNCQIQSVHSISLKIHSSYLQLIFPSIGQFSAAFLSQFSQAVTENIWQHQAGSGYRCLHRAQHGHVPWLSLAAIDPAMPCAMRHDRGEGTPLPWICGVNSFNLARWRSSFMPLGVQDEGLSPEDGTDRNGQRKVVACFSLTVALKTM